MMQIILHSSLSHSYGYLCTLWVSSNDNKENLHEEKQFPRNRTVHIYISASASDICDVPEAVWQPNEALQAKFVDHGWSIKNIKVDDGCYEAYASSDTGKKVEAYFNPKIF